MQRAARAMTTSHRAAVVLALLLAGCHAIYGNDRAAPAMTATAPLAAAPVQRPPPNASTARTRTEIPPGGSGTTAVGAGMPGATVAGTLAGGYFGRRLGSQFNGSARQAAAAAERRALADNAPADWSDPQSATSGRVRPLRSFTDAAGRECREYSQTVNIAGRRNSDTGIACLQSGGGWSLVGG
jgi:surface antigen